MGTTLLSGSCEPFSGKSALVLGIAQQLIRSGLLIRFGKPLATSLEWDPAKGPLPQPLIDDDVRFVGDTLGMPSECLIPSLHLLSPATATQRLGQGQLEAGDGFGELRSQVMAADGLTLLECAGSLQEGLLYGLSLPQLAEGLEAKVVLVHLWQDSCSVDALLADSIVLDESFLKTPEGEGYGFVGPALDGSVWAGFGEGVTMSGQFATQVTAVVATVAWSGVATFVICKVAGALGGGLRANDDEITEGLDLSYHGERDYNF